MRIAQLSEFDTDIEIIPVVSATGYPIQELTHPSIAHSIGQVCIGARHRFVAYQLTKDTDEGIHVNLHASVLLNKPVRGDVYVVYEKGGVPSDFDVMLFHRLLSKSAPPSPQRHDSGVCL